MIALYIKHDIVLIISEIIEDKDIVRFKKFYLLLIVFTNILIYTHITPVRQDYYFKANNMPKNNIYQ